MAAVLGNDDSDGGGTAGGKPVAPSNDEAGVVAEPATGKIVLAAAPGNRRAELRDRRSAEERVQSSGDPNTDKHPRIGKSLRNFAGRSNDSGSDSVADGRSHAEPYAEDLEQAAAASRGNGANFGRGFR